MRQRTQHVEGARLLKPTTAKSAAFSIGEIRTAAEQRCAPLSSEERQPAGLGALILRRDRTGPVSYTHLNRAAVLGYEGKWAIHPSQVTLCNELSLIHI